jgi:hypothetical protein
MRWRCTTDSATIIQVRSITFRSPTAVQAEVPEIWAYGMSIRSGRLAEVFGGSSCSWEKERIGWPELLRFVNSMLDRAIVLTGSVEHRI